MIQMMTWRKGRQLVAERIRRGERPIEDCSTPHDSSPAGPGHGGVPVQGRRAKHRRPWSTTSATTRCCTATPCWSRWRPRTSPASTGQQATRGHPDRARRASGRAALRLHGGAGRAGGLGQGRVPWRALRSRRRHLLPRPRDRAGSGKAPGMHPRASSSSCCSTGRRQCQRGSSTCRPDRVFEVGSHVEI